MDVPLDSPDLLSVDLSPPRLPSVSPSESDRGTETESTSQGDAPNYAPFLDLPAELRNYIYRLAIYDHDRGAVFLPRAVPRKVTPKIDVDVEEVILDEDDETGMVRYLAWSSNHGRSFAAGVWVEGKPRESPLQVIEEAESAEVAVNDTEDEEVDVLHDDSKCSEEALWREANQICEDADECFEELTPAELCVAGDFDDPCTCDCHDADSTHEQSQGEDQVEVENQGQVESGEQGQVEDGERDQIDNEGQDQMDDDGQDKLNSKNRFKLLMMAVKININFIPQIKNPSPL